MSPSLSRRLAGVLTAAVAALAWSAACAHAAASLYVSAGATTDPACAAASQANPFATLSGALACAPKGATILIGPGSFAGRVTIPTNVTLVGAGASTVIVGSTDIKDSRPDLRIGDGRSVAIKNLTIDGVSGYAQGIVAGSGKLTITDTTIKNTGARGAYGAGLSVKPASGVANVTVNASTFADNTGDNGGGGIYVTSGPDTATPSSLTVANSTLTGNDGGAIMLGTASLVARDATIAGNAGGGISKDFYPGTVTLKNTILAGNSGGECQVAAAKVVDGGHNLIGA